jgi:Nif-specific regulatory protein
MEFLINISSIISHSNDIYQELEVVLQQLCTHLNAQFSMITIVDHSSERIMIGAACGLSAEDKNKGTYRIGEGVIGKVVQTGKSIIIPDILSSKDFLNKLNVRIRTDRMTAFLCIPIIIKSRIIGTLSIHKEHRYDTDLAYEVKFLNLTGMLIGKNVTIHRRHIEELEELRRENQRFKPSRPDNIIGNSSVMHDLYQLIERVSPTGSTVMIRGESGVGKELIAEAIHNSSERRQKPFVKVNCSALPESLIESELFGHEKGSFTGANTSHTGRFELANGGTLFLDEIGDIPLSIQVKLLRVLQQKQLERVGGTKTIDVDVRIIVATNRNLEEMILNNTFREDLYYRINVFPIYVPALRERRADITILADHFINKLNKRNNTTVMRITGSALDMLMIYSWPGNIRELENVIERAMILTTDNVIHSYNLPPSLQTGISTGTVGHGPLEVVLSKVEKQMILDALIAVNGSLPKAAEKLGITERILWLRTKKYAINNKLYKHLTAE